MTMLEARDGDRRTYLEIAGVVEERSARATDELRQLWRRVVLTVRVSDTDTRATTVSSTSGRPEARTGDLNPDPRPGPTRLSTDVDGSGVPATLGAVLAVCGLFRLSPAQGRTIVTEVAAAVSTWRRVASSYGLTPSQVGAMAPALSVLDDVSGL